MKQNKRIMCYMCDCCKYETSLRSRMASHLKTVRHITNVDSDNGQLKRFKWIII